MNLFINEFMLRIHFSPKQENSIQLYLYLSMSERGMYLCNSPRENIYFYNLITL